MQHTVSRVGLLDQAEKLIGDLGSSQSVLEIQYEGEVSKTSCLRVLRLLLIRDMFCSIHVKFLAVGYKRQFHIELETSALPVEAGTSNVSVNVQQYVTHNLKCLKVY